MEQRLFSLLIAVLITAGFLIFLIKYTGDVAPGEKEKKDLIYGWAQKNGFNVRSINRTYRRTGFLAIDRIYNIRISDKFGKTYVARAIFSSSWTTAEGLDVAWNGDSPTENEFGNVPSPLRSSVPVQSGAGSSFLLIIGIAALLRPLFWVMLGLAGNSTVAQVKDCDSVASRRRNQLLGFEECHYQYISDSTQESDSVFLLGLTPLFIMPNNQVNVRFIRLAGTGAYSIPASAARSDLSVALLGLLISYWIRKKRTTETTAN